MHLVAFENIEKFEMENDRITRLNQIALNGIFA